MNIALIINPVTGGWTPNDDNTWGGGGEAVVFWARALSTRGHIVHIFWDQTTTHDHADDRIQYYTYADCRDGYDVAIYRKCPELYRTNRAKCSILWTDQVRTFDATGFHGIVVASPFLSRSLGNLLPGLASVVQVIPDGYDALAFQKEPAPLRVPQLVLHASSPDRGLATLLNLWPEILAERPTAQLAIAYGWDVFDRCHGSSALKQSIITAVERLPTESVSLRRYSYADMQQMFRTAGLWAYYCTGGEFFCQSAIKAQVGGAVPVVRPFGALHQTVFSGIKADTPQQFVQALCMALDPEHQTILRKELTLSISQVACVRTWDQVAEAWEQLLLASPSVPLTHIPPTPETPMGLIPQPVAIGMQAVQQAVTEWLNGLTAASNVWVDPALDLSLARSGQPLIYNPDVPIDVAIIGWSLEDTHLDPRTSMDAIPDGIPVLCFTSFGPWRATQRFRMLSRMDVVEVFGKQSQCAMRVQAIDGESNGMIITTFVLSHELLGSRNIIRARSAAAPRQTVTACFIARNATGAFQRTLEGVIPIVDEIVVIDTGSTDDTKELVQRFGEDHRDVAVTLLDGTSPRWCYDCLREHQIGEMQPGHRIAGFETPRNESIAPARGDWILWLDCDEELTNPQALAKYLKPNGFDGYAINQHHFSVDPPEATKIDTPVRLFRRLPDGTAPGLFPYGEHSWPTFHPGLRARFAGVIHEHPGGAPLYYEGISPVVVLSDVRIAHNGYLTEAVRRARFVRNWPLMVADRQKYPPRRLGIFLWLRDLVHHMRYQLERNGGRPTPYAVELAEWAQTIFRDSFLESNDPFSLDALGYYSAAMQMLGQGQDVQLGIQSRKPEITGEEQRDLQISGRVANKAEFMRLLAAKADVIFDRWEGDYL